MNNDCIGRTSFVKDVLIHVFAELHHRGEMIAILWQMDVSHRLAIRGEKRQILYGL
jgi:uncharacterized damage-inducible protein DinB